MACFAIRRALLLISCKLSKVQSPRLWKIYVLWYLKLGWKQLQNWYFSYTLLTLPKSTYSTYRSNFAFTVCTCLIEKVAKSIKTFCTLSIGILKKDYNKKFTSFSAWIIMLAKMMFPLQLFKILLEMGMHLGA